MEREIDLLQRKIAAVRRQSAAAQPGGNAAAAADAPPYHTAASSHLGDENDDTAAAAAAGVGRQRRRGTRTAIERDRALARLGLGVVEEFPRDVLVDIVQVCVLGGGVYWQGGVRV